MTVTKPVRDEDGTQNLGPLIRKRRKQLGLTLQALCDGAGLSVGYLSQVERSKAVPTLGTLAQIAQSLDVELGYFVSAPAPTDGLSRAGERPEFSLAGSDVTYEAISADYPRSEMSSYILHMPPGYASETVTHEGEEIVYVLEGAIEQTLAGESIVLNAGDSLHYDGETPHSCTNPHDTPARVLWTGTLSVLHPADGPNGARRLPRLAAANSNVERR